MNFHTLIAKNGDRRREIEAGEVSSENRPKNHTILQLERQLMSGKGRVVTPGLSQSFWHRSHP
ncbi:unnamed protein product [Prunus armeniaca]